MHAAVRHLRFLPLTFAVVLVACTVRDPEGTEWDTVLRIRSAPDTLFVEDSDGDHVRFDPDGEMRLVQEIEPIRTRLGDSLLLRGTNLRLDLPLGPIRLPDGLELAAPLPFEALFPDFVPLVGSLARIEESRVFELTIPLPAWEALEWAALREALAELTAEEAFGFALDELRLELRNGQGEVLLDEALGEGGGLESDQPWTGDRPFAGLLLPPLSIRVSGRNRPMTEAAFVAGGSLLVGLATRDALADSARGLLPAQTLDGTGEFDGDRRWLLNEALARNLELGLRVENSLEVPVGLRLVWSDWLDPATDEAFELAVEDLAAGEDRRLLLEQGGLLVRPADHEAPQSFPLHAIGGTLPTDQPHTLRAGDRLGVEIETWSARLAWVDGTVLEEIAVPMEAGLREIEVWPAELVAVDLSQIEVQFRLDRDLRVELLADLVLDVRSAPATGLADTTMRLLRTVVAGDSLLRIERMGPLLSRLPEQLGFSGWLRMQAGTQVRLADSSSALLTTLEIPARGNLSGLRWATEPELVEEALPEEVERVDLLALVENGVPLGGRLKAWITDDSLSDGVPVFDENLRPALWENDTAWAVFDSLAFDLSAEAMEVARGDRWWLRYELELEDASERTVVLRARQAVVIVGQVEARVPVDFENGVAP